MRGRESDGFCASLHRMQRIEVASHPGLRGVEREKRLRCISPREDVKHHFKAPPTPPRATPLSFPLSVSRLG